MIENVFATDRVFIGCSGYYYKTWKDQFYPNDLPVAKWLAHYATVFNTIEINATFYKFPTFKSLDAWRVKTPYNYKIAIKAHKSITHTKRFAAVDAEMHDFYSLAKEGLQDKIGPILFQLPPSFKYEPAHLQRILLHLDLEFDNVLEFRHPSWWIPEVYDMLARNNITFCSVSYPGLPEEVIRTSPRGYVRFHGNVELFKSTYTAQELETWFAKIKEAGFDQTHIYFNNTWFNGAIENAQAMKKLYGV